METQEPGGGQGWGLTAFSVWPSAPLSFCWTVGFVLTGDSGCPRAGVGKGLAGWGRTFFPDGSSSESDGGLFTPAMPPTGRRHTQGQGTQASPVHWL